MSAFWNDQGALVKSKSTKRTLLFHRRVPTFMEAKELELRRTARGMSPQAWDTVLRGYGISPGGYRKVLNKQAKGRR